MKLPRFARKSSFWATTIVLVILLLILLAAMGMTPNMRAWCATPLRQATMGDLLLLGIILSFVLNTYRYK